MAAKNIHHVLLVTFPAQGHINPSLQFAKRLAKLGVAVTFLTSSSAVRRMTTTAAAINFASFSDGFDGGWSNDETQNFMAALRTHGSKAVEDAVAAAAAENRPFSRVIYTLLVPWAGQVAHRLRVPVTLLWIQPAILFGVYFYYFNKYFDAAAMNEEDDGNNNNNNKIIELPGLPPFAPSDLPSFMSASNPSMYDFALPTFTENFEILDREISPTVLINTFQSLESEALTAITKYKLTAIGPLIPSAFLDGKDPTDTSFGGDLIKKPPSQDYLQYLDSKPKSSVVYVAFGSYSELSKPQMAEIAKGLIKSGKPFLWVIRGAESVEKLDGIFSGIFPGGGSLMYREELERQGKIVGWCTQVEVLSHPSVGCFFTHCGWNSTLESLVCGVPVVGFPQWTDQTTNAKLVEDFWRSGVRVGGGGGGGVVEGDEIERCLGVVMGGGDRAAEMRREAEKWRGLAKEAMEEDGSSNVNLKSFVDELLL
ncbi:hypothetical protein ABFS82_14G039100 [Erythranthe guttata]|uniref:Glycosyltransferase n=1 Tax=Erythranthe guttata TaxID=4155 RepID=A0A022QZF7_ERYGU|nr:PREDICTED: crocetin glucosyltransferase, chloroplastic-like [Erythranthe guttata]EYU32718.1 hypothetical protein MIMGU_mgv1a005538mg [Erythranthe guttata]|eukprot:XP_012842982.1 PREDICTED: crocetin glucosyltransferase, chloroplastic-like [Erythranthe guttata]